MDPRLLDYYRQELLHIREGAAEFAREHPKIAARLALDATTAQGECVDPYVERLLEGFAFLTARVQIRQDAEYPRLTQHLLEMVYPGFLAPTPSMLIVQLEPDLNDAGLAAGLMIARGSVMNARLQPGETHQLPLHDQPGCKAVAVAGCRGALPVACDRCAGAPPCRSAGKPRAKHAGQVQGHRGAENEPAHARSARSSSRRRRRRRPSDLRTAVCQLHAPWWCRPPPGAIRNTRCCRPARCSPADFDDDEALLPVSPRSFGGYRLMKEYAAFPGALPVLQRQWPERGIEDAWRPTSSNSSSFSTGSTRRWRRRSTPAASCCICTPAINLFAKRADRIDVNRRDHELHVVADRARPMDYEVHSIVSVTGYDESRRVRGSQLQSAVRPVRQQCAAPGAAYYSMRRVPRLLSEAQRQRGPRAGYIGTELYLSLVDVDEAPYSGNVSQLAVEIIASNRDLPLMMSVGSKDDFTFEDSAPVQGVRCIKGPTRPVAPMLEGQTPWRLLSHLSLNYLSLCDTDAQQGAAALREILSLYGIDSRSRLHKHIDGIASVSQQAGDRAGSGAGADRLRPRHRDRADGRRARLRRQRRDGSRHRPRTLLRPLCQPEQLHPADA